MQSVRFKKYNIEADYSIIEPSDKNLPEVIQKIRSGLFSGINVTLPFKQKIINHIDKIVNDAELTGSVNTLLLDNEKLVVGENTDVFGLQAAYLKEIDKWRGCVLYMDPNDFEGLFYILFR